MSIRWRAAAVTVALAGAGGLPAAAHVPKAPGSSTVQPDNVRLRAATGKSKLTRKTAEIENGRLIVSGAITSEARVVRIRLGYDRPDASSAFLYWNATITNGTWKLDRTLPAEAAKGGQLSIRFTGYEPRNLRGEQTANRSCRKGASVRETRRHVGSLVTASEAALPLCTAMKEGLLAGTPSVSSRSEYAPP